MEKKSVEKDKVNNKPLIKKQVKRNKPSVYHEPSETEKILIENFVSLQKVMVNLSVKFDGLTNQISKLLELFEMSAKALTEKDFDIEKNNKENMKILEKIENVLEQNKTIARGLTLMHEKISEPPKFSTPAQGPRIPPPQKLPFKPVQKNFMAEGPSEEYHRAISPEEE
jgi:hypothetical protein